MRKRCKDNKSGKIMTNNLNKKHKIIERNLLKKNKLYKRDNKKDSIFMSNLSCKRF